MDHHTQATFHWHIPYMDTHMAAMLIQATLMAMAMPTHGKYGGSRIGQSDFVDAHALCYCLIFDIL